MFYYGVILTRWYIWVSQPFSTLANDLLLSSRFTILCCWTLSYSSSCSYCSNLVVWSSLRNFNWNWLRLRLLEIMRNLKLLTYLRSITYLSSLLWYGSITTSRWNEKLSASSLTLKLFKHFLKLLLILDCILGFCRISLSMMRLGMIISECLCQCSRIIAWIFWRQFKRLWKQGSACL